ncbi:MAG: hypothetical protein Unbinned400contig1000_26 [Prokaryotic dsDNA virus sp.]|nr:MAG: hypothetical protein Unbinned400contig1000_26 [Prokaryotic dsDNA virus sp.]
MFGGEAGTGTPYHAEVIGTNHAPFYDCIVREIQAGTDADLTVADNAPVLDLIDLHHFEETMNVGGKLLCWELGTNSYVGIQYFGRSTIGLP